MNKYTLQDSGLLFSKASKMIAEHMIQEAKAVFKGEIEGDEAYFAGRRRGN